MDFPTDPIRPDTCDKLSGKLVVFDLDGTLVEGDLGEAVFYLLLILQAAGLPFEQFEQMLSKIQKGPGVIAGENHGVSGLMRAYLDAMDQGRYVEAYRVTAEYYLNFPREKILQLARTVLERDLAPLRTRITLGDESFHLQFHARTEPMMSDLVKTIHGKGADLMILSASPQCAVEAFCLHEGLPLSCAHGARRDHDGSIDVPYGKRKLDIIRAHQAEPPYMVFGNSQGDMEMLEAAIYPFVRKTSQPKFLEKAREQHWYTI